MSSAQPSRWKTLIAFAIIYFVWGSTFYAIRAQNQRRLRLGGAAIHAGRHRQT